MAAELTMQRPPSAGAPLPSRHAPPAAVEPATEDFPDTRTVDPAAAAALANSRVMMVDDEPILISVVQAFLEDAGYRDFVSVSDSERALPRIRSERPDVLLLDLMMPEVDGFQILRELRSDPNFAYLPVIVMTAASDAATKLKVLELGATDFLEKPVDPSELALRVRNTLAFKAYRDRLEYYDALTGLPNRKQFLRSLTDALSAARRNGGTCALLKVNLDRFKQINKTLGHRAGDDLLKAFGLRVQGCLHDSDPLMPMTGIALGGGNSLARIGGDEFAVLMPDLERVELAAQLARRIGAALNSPFIIDGREFFVSASIGVTTYPEDADDAETLLRHSVSALAQAKQRGGNACVFYSRKFDDRAMERLTLESELRRALERAEFELHYQPKVDLQTGAIIGAEALIRWRHPERGMIPPGMFIAIAEESNLIVPIGAWVIREACRQSVAWSRIGLSIPISVNVATPHLRDGRLITDVRQALADAHASAPLLCVELTESVLMSNTRENMATLIALKRMGVSMSLDDFGTGYSSLAYLKRMPLNELKIDRSFVSGLPDDGDSAAIVRAVIAMAKSLGLTVVAEGVETQGQLAFLRDEGCDSFQGFLFSKPVPPAQFEALRMQKVPA